MKQQSLQSLHNPQVQEEVAHDETNCENFVPGNLAIVKEADEVQHMDQREEHDDDGEHKEEVVDHESHEEPDDLREKSNEGHHGAVVDIGDGCARYDVWRSCKIEGR